MASPLMYHFSMANLATTTTVLKKNYLPLIKSRQTLLLAFTGAAGYLCQPPTPFDWPKFVGLVGSLLTTISGCTVLNMVFDRDIDGKMERTRNRPLCGGQVRALTAGWLGSGLLAIGLLWAAFLSIPVLAVILTGACLNVLVYTIWLKRRSAWSIIWGGVAGGMPILAGRVLAIGHVDLLGLLMALVIVCWIPSHNLTLGMLYSSDYSRAGVPTVLIAYGSAVTHFLIAFSSILVSFLMIQVFNQLGLVRGVMMAFCIISLGLVGLALYSWVNPAPKMLGIAYKYSSFYLLICAILLVFNGVV
jgi:protoheme IX farnesyltransferase